MAALILTAGSVGKRMALPSSRVLIHQPWGGAQGQARDIGIQAKEILRLKKLTIEYFAKHCSKDCDQLAADMERDFYMSAKDAVDYGIVDKILIRGDDGKTA
ncbi:MAG: hypothetical protein Ta2B_13020 [Termitinemataceae bacterium]|nr:MAG: hypothetical protein Ta2B_13020 [Termitinemataceae bacterium]